jgi:hypothetical protein
MAGGRRRDAGPRARRHGRACRQSAWPASCSGRAPAGWSAGSVSRPTRCAPRRRDRRDVPWHCQGGTAWFESADDERSRAWVGGAGRALAPWSGGETYPNFIADAASARLRAAYSLAVLERLQAIRAEWDPGNVLSAGHAIPLR